jgi:hypothetical protein
MNKKVKILILILAIPCGLIIWFDQSRSFYCTSEGRCVTVWKRIGGKCYVIPDKFFGVMKPSDNFIETINHSNMGIIWNYKNQCIVSTTDENAMIFNKDKTEIYILNYNLNKAYNDSVYMYFDGTYPRYKKDVNFISIDILEGYAKDKDGKKL